MADVAQGGEGYPAETQASQRGKKNRKGRLPVPKGGGKVFPFSHGPSLSLLTCAGVSDVLPSGVLVGMGRPSTALGVWRGPWVCGTGCLMPTPGPRRVEVAGDMQQGAMGEPATDTPYLSGGGPHVS